MPPDAHPRGPGRVLLVGAGPGPVDLMTVRALREVGRAQALLYDALVDAEVLDQAPRACLRIQTGKRAGGASMKQETINRLMLRLARGGLRVVRLKGGDPSVFGRSGEETGFLRERGIEVEIVPGVTAASAAAAQFGFPLTHRGMARRLVLATARTERGALTDDGWMSAADTGASLGLYMARDCAGLAADRLMAAGRSSRTPVIAVEHAGGARARAVRSTLATLGEDLIDFAPSGPVVILVGEVVGLGAYEENAANPTATCLRRTQVG